MFKGNITTATPVTANTNIPFNVVWNTNDNTAYNATENYVEFRKSGYYNINAILNVTGVATTPVSIAFYSNGQIIAETTESADVTPTTGLYALEVKDTIKVDPAFINSFANISIRANTDITVSNAVFTVEKVR